MAQEIAKTGTGPLGGASITQRHRRWAGAFAAAACLFLGALLATPATADPSGPAVPDAGARPPALAGLPTPGTGTQTSPTVSVPVVLGPLAQQIRAETAAVQTLAEQLKEADEELGRIRQDVATKRRAADDAEAAVKELRAKAETVAADAYKASTKLGPLREYAGDLHRLGKVAPAIGPQPGGEATARELNRVEDAARAAADVYRLARDTESVVAKRRESVKTSYDQKVAALAALRNRNSAELERAEAEEDAYERSVGLSLNLGAGPDGWAPHPDVEKVLNYAKSKLGKPYVFGAEGPDAYDCSGLIWDSYRQVGVKLPRIANQQYAATTKIPRENLLPGDLVFFGPPGSWVGIGHMGMYIGGGRMIQAPTTGQRVKVSVVSWSRFYGATRVLPARKIPPPAPAPTATSTRPTSPAPTSPSATTSPTKSPTTSPSTSSKPPSSTPPASPGSANGGQATVSPSRSPG